MRTQDILKWIAWKGINPALLSLPSRGISFDTRYRGLNIGCGLDNPPNWLGMDGGVYVLWKHVPRPLVKLAYGVSNNARKRSSDDFLDALHCSRILHRDATRRLPFATDSVPAVFSSHFFEHLKSNEARRLASECYRVMMPGSIIRICVPSLDESIAKIEAALDEYRRGNVEPIQRFVTHNSTGFKDPYSNHRWMYDFREMKALLVEAGFIDIKRCSVGSGRIPDVESLDTRPGLFVEGLKPAYG